MKLEELPEMPATKTEQESKALVGSMLLRPGWVYYNKENEDLTLYLIRRFLAAHARMPGVFTPTVCGAPKPLAVLRYHSEKIDLVEGAVYLNGGIVRMTEEDHENLFLFISKEDAEFWNYPDTHKVFSLSEDS